MKRTISLLLVCVMLLMTIPFSVGVAAAVSGGVIFNEAANVALIEFGFEFIRGDIDEDNDVSSRDSNRLKYILVADVTDFDVGRCDANGDGLVSIKDSLYIKKVIAGSAEMLYVGTGDDNIQFLPSTDSGVAEVSVLNGKLPVTVLNSRIAVSGKRYFSIVYKATSASVAEVSAGGEALASFNVIADSKYHTVILDLGTLSANSVNINFSANPASNDKIYIDSMGFFSDVEECELFATAREESRNPSTPSAVTQPSAITVRCDSSFTTDKALYPARTVKTYDSGEEAMKLVVDGNGSDPSVFLDLNSYNINASEYKYIVFVNKVPGSCPTSGLMSQFFLCADNITGATGGYSTEQFYVAKADTYTSEIINLSSGFSYWKNHVNGIRLDYFGSGSAGNDMMFVHSLIFCKTNAEAQFYAAAAPLAANSKTAIPPLPGNSRDMRNIINTISTDPASSERLDANGRLCISAGTASRFNKASLEKRIAEALTKATTQTPKVTVLNGYDELKAQYDASEKAEYSITLRIDYGNVSYTGLVPVGVYVRNVIYDNDAGSDCDDGGAEAIVIKAHRDGYVKVLAITHCVNNAYSPQMSKAICDYYGVNDIEIGENRDRYTLTDSGWYDCSKVPADRYYGSGTRPTFRSNVEIIRDKLSHVSDDKEVVVMSTGMLTTIKALMVSGADSYSSLSGEALFKQKVDRYACGGGNFPNGSSENNFMFDPDASTEVINIHLADYPIIFVGSEVSGTVMSGGCLAGRDDYILKWSYEKLKGAGNVVHNSWDQGVVFYAMFGTSNGFFCTSDNWTIRRTGDTAGTITITSGGINSYVQRTGDVGHMGDVYDSWMVPNAASIIK